MTTLPIMGTKMVVVIKVRSTIQIMGIPMVVNQTEILLIKGEHKEILEGIIKTTSQIPIMETTKETRAIIQMEV